MTSAVPLSDPSGEDAILRSISAPCRMQRDLMEYPTRYQRVKELGRGRFGVVYQVKDPNSGNDYAAKHIKYICDTTK